MSANQPKPSTVPRKPTPKLHYFHNEPYHLFLSYLEGHPMSIHQKFPLGHLRIFDQQRMFSRELTSMEHLNAGLEWNCRFFCALMDGFRGFQVMGREDAEDRAMDFRVRGDVDQGEQQVLMRVVLEEDFGSDVRKQFWREFENYNEAKNHQIEQQEQQIKSSNQHMEHRLQQIKKYCQNAEKEKKQLLGRLSAILTEKVNKLKEYEEDYTIQLLEDKFKKAREQQEQRVMSTYQEDAEFGGSLFQPSQDFR